MLTITGRAESPRATLELDPHVPFVLRIGNAPGHGESLIWYCEPDDRSIFEVWIDGKTGALHRVALVAINPNRISRTKAADSGPTVPTSERVPVGDTAAWQDPRVVKNLDQITERDQFSLLIGANFISIRFGETGEPKEWVVSHRARFGVDKTKRLCRVELTGLTLQDIAAINDAVTPCEPKKE